MNTKDKVKPTKTNISHNVVSDNDKIQQGDGVSKTKFKQKTNYKKTTHKYYNKGKQKKYGQYHYQYPYSRVILTKRVDKVVSGGRNSSFVAIVVIGNLVDRVGVGSAGGRTIIDAITHAKQNAMNRVITPGKVKYIKFKYCASTVLIKEKNTDITKCAGYLSTIFKACGLKNISCKLIGSRNSMNAIYAVFNALSDSIKQRKNTAFLKQKLKL